LVSPGKGLIWYYPTLLLGLAEAAFLVRRSPRLLLLVTGVAGTYVLVHTTYNHWHGGGSRELRLIMPVVPLVVFLAVELLERKIEKRGVW